MSKRVHLRPRFFALAIAAVIVLTDRITKIEIKHTLSNFDAIPVIPGWLRIIHTENPGAAFGMLAEGNPTLRSLVLIGASSLVLIFVAWALFSGRGGMTGKLTRFGLALIFGGALGNLYDRIVHLTVTDFIEVYHGSWSFPAFNVADSAISVGAVLLFLDMWRSKPANAVPSAPSRNVS